MEPLERSVKASLERACLIEGDDPLIAAVSGGPDSMAMLYSLLGLIENPRQRLHVAHLNHNFRDEAEEDARFVSSQAADLGLSATVGKADPAAYQKEAGISSFEEAAREVRYGFLSRVAAERHAAAIALGHTADDLAETVLMHIIRGSGAHGLRGMEELSTWRSRNGSQKAVLFRPLLQVTKADTLAHCRKRDIPFREDPANLLPQFTRNSVRHELLPSLEKYNPRIREALVRLARSASLEVDYLDRELDRLWPTVASLERDSVLLGSSSLASLHPLMRRLLLRRAYRELTGDTRRLEAAHLEAMDDFMGGPPGRELDLPRGVRLCSTYGQIVLTLRRELPSPFYSLDGEYELTLPSPGEENLAEVSGWKVMTRLLPSSQPSEENAFVARFELEALGGRVWVRARRPGDRFQPRGMRSEKKLQDFFVDEKAPRAWRDRIPLVVSERGVAWVVGYRVAEWARTGENSSHICEIRFSPKG